MKAFAKMSTAELQTQHDVLTAECEAACHKADLCDYYFELVDELIALSAILGRRNGSEIYATLAHRPMGEDAALAGTAQ